MKPPRPTVNAFDDVPLYALLRKAQRTYGAAVEDALRRSGCDDLPPSGVQIISTMSWTEASLAEVLRWMGVSKQAASQSVDAIVARGYLERARNETDRRRVDLRLTPKGRLAGQKARAAIERVDAQLRKAVGNAHIQVARATMIALIRLRG